MILKGPKLKSQHSQLVQCCSQNVSCIWCLKSICRWHMDILQQLCSYLLFQGDSKFYFLRHYLHFRSKPLTAWLALCCVHMNLHFVFARRSKLEGTVSFACAPPTVLSMAAQRCPIKESSKKKKIYKARLAPSPRPHTHSWNSRRCVQVKLGLSYGALRSSNENQCVPRGVEMHIACHAVQCASRVHAWILLVLDSAWFWSTLKRFMRGP